MAVVDRSTGLVCEAVISLNDSAVISWVEVKGAQAPVAATEADAALLAARHDPRVAAALRRRGIDDVNSVHLEPWPFGSAPPAEVDASRRLIWTPMWHRPEPGANVYAHPIPGLHAIVDLDSSEVVLVEDDDGGVPIPPTPGPYRAAVTGADVGLKPLSIVQPEGSSLVVDGWELRWERWSLRLGFCQREGLVIHDVRFNDRGEERRIAHRLSIAELVIPYGDGCPAAHRKQAFDTGEYGLGNYTNSLTLGCDCLGVITYADVALAAPDGTVRVVPNGICLHEEDAGVLWKHTDEAGHVELRRGRRLVVSTMSTVNNYEYGYNWLFTQDGCIEFEAKLTGIVLTVAGAPGGDHRSSTELEPGLLAPFHQHVFCARLSLDLDGGASTAYEVA